MTTSVSRGFERGERLTLRPVQTGDLAQLAAVMAEDPLPHRQQPWTLDRLKKEFEDEKSPGLWSDTARMFVAVLEDGTVAGYVEENPQAWLHALLLYLHVLDGLPEREALGQELVDLHLAYRRRWYNDSLLLIDVVEPDQAKAEWLKRAGFSFEMRMERSALFLGRAVARDTYSLFSAERLADPDLSTGEPAYPPSGSRLTGGEA